MGSLDSSRNLQANYAIIFLFHLDLILHAYKILFRCDRFEILNFATKRCLARRELKAGHRGAECAAGHRARAPPVEEVGAKGAPRR